MYRREEGYCATCSGTGEGQYEGSRCYRCSGSGTEDYEVEIEVPASPLAWLTTVTVVTEQTTKAQALLWRKELEALYDAHYDDHDGPNWTWDDVHDLDRDLLVELEEITSQSEAAPFPPDVITSFRTRDWRPSANT